jgi:hypothetical protein
MAEGKPNWQLVEGRRNDNSWKAENWLARASGIATWRATQRVLETLEKERRERREAMTQTLFIAMGSAVLGAAIFKLLYQLH